MEGVVAQMGREEMGLLMQAGLHPEGVPRRNRHSAPSAHICSVVRLQLVVVRVAREELPVVDRVQHQAAEAAEVVGVAKLCL